MVAFFRRNACPRAAPEFISNEDVSRNINFPFGTKLSISLAGIPAGLDPTVVKSTGTAANVIVQLLDKTIPVDITGSRTMSPQAAGSDGSLTIPYQARQYAIGAVEAGLVIAAVTYTLSYRCFRQTSGR